MEVKFEGKEIIITTADLFKGDKPVTLGADTNYHDTGFYIFAYDGNKTLNSGDVVDKDKDLASKEDNLKVGLIYNDKEVLFNSNDTGAAKASLLVDTPVCVNLGEGRTGDYTNKLLYRKYKDSEKDLVQTGTYYVTLNGQKIEGMSIRIGTNVPCIMKEQTTAKYVPVFLVYNP